MNRPSNTQTRGITKLYRTRRSRHTAPWPAPRRRGTDPHLSTRLLKAVPGQALAGDQPDMAPTTKSLRLRDFRLLLAYIRTLWATNSRLEATARTAGKRKTLPARITPR
jgi:hypothetical protein